MIGSGKSTSGGAQGARSLGWRRAAWQGLQGACAAVMASALLLSPSTLTAQPPVMAPSTQERAPLSRDRVLVEWIEPDSVMRELTSREGYRVVQYQGSTVQFDASTRQLTMRGKPSAVRRDETMLVGDTIVYDDSTKIVVARGDTVILRDPTQEDGDDFIARGEIRYDLETQEGTTGEFATSVVSGERLYVSAQSSTFYNDTTLAGGQRVFFHGADFTYCDLEDPHFHFTSNDIKFVSNTVVVARNAVLYIGEVPVFWLPFFFQDGRSGRRSGLLTPRFGVAELFRNSANYQRSVDNVGWFFALSDFADAQLSLDWLSGGSASNQAAGFVRYNSDIRYKFLSRFIDGQLAVSQTNRSDEQKNTSVTWRHNQSFSKNTRLAANINFVTNTTVQRQTTFNPVASVATIVSQLNYSTKIGPASINVGGTRKQYPGRQQTEMNLPNLNLTMGTLAFGAVEWTPSVRFNQTRTDNIDQGLQFGYVYRPGVGGLDSTRVNANRRNTNFGFETPIKIFDFQIGNSISITERFDDYPEVRTVRDVNDTSKVSRRVYAQRFFTNIDWNTSFNLPRFFQGTWNLSPNVQLANSDPSAGLIVRSELSGGRYVSQSKRLLYGLSAAPTLNGFFPGVGPVEAFRHTINPSLSYTLSPSADVSDAFLQATGRTRQGYLGSLPRNAVSLTFSTVLEAKLRPKPADETEQGGVGAAGDSPAADTAQAAAQALRPGDEPGRPTAPVAAEQGRKLRLLALNFSPLSYDFIRADTAASGFVEQNFRISARTDLLPNLDFQMGYELFQGDPISDTAVFSPYRTELGVNFSLDGKSSIVGLISRLLGIGSGEIETASEADSLTQASRSDFAQRGGGIDAAGANSRGANLPMGNAGMGWRASITYNANRQRPFKQGTTADTVGFNPADQCIGLLPGTLQYEDCIAGALTSPPPGLDNQGINTPGGPFFLRPPNENISGNLGFGLTEKWSTTMSAQYDLVRRDFGSLQVGLQRELHDWNAVFSFARVPNGNFVFNFLISLKANADVKFNYDRRTVR